MPEQSVYCAACDNEQLHYDGVCVVCATEDDDDWSLGLPACGLDDEGCEACQ